MTKARKVNIGIVGACARGGSFKAGCDAVGVNIVAVCDINDEGLVKAKKSLGAKESYTDYAEMLGRSDIEAVIIGTPMPFHAEQSIMALESGRHVLSEVTAAVSWGECRRLVEAVESSG
ncbi:MAG: Gfo/Idh/MocA family oxidoreductase, partial [Victivallales bacterium]|nr:Gfo/Idh/MocA family oxidoreductase [Victivallales bacterium]